MILSACKKAVIFLCVQVLLVAVVVLHLGARRDRFQRDVTYHEGEAARIPPKENMYAFARHHIGAMGLTNEFIHGIVRQGGYEIYRDPVNHGRITLLAPRPQGRTP